MRLTMSRMLPSTRMMLSVAWLVQKPKMSRLSLPTLTVVTLLMLFTGADTVGVEPVSDAITLGFTNAHSPPTDFVTKKNIAGMSLSFWMNSDETFSFMENSRHLKLSIHRKWRWEFKLGRFPWTDCRFLVTLSQAQLSHNYNTGNMHIIQFFFFFDDLFFSA